MGCIEHPNTFQRSEDCRLNVLQMVVADVKGL